MVTGTVLPIWQTPGIEWAKADVALLDNNVCREHRAKDYPKESCIPIQPNRKIMMPIPLAAVTCCSAVTHGTNDADTMGRIGAPSLWIFGRP